MTLQDKHIILGVSGGIAAYKMANVASALAKMGLNVHTIMTENATRIITPLTFSTLTGHKTIVNTFDETVHYNVAHVSLAKQADALLLAPATANLIAKLAWGLADDMLTTTALACRCPKIVAPAMNTAMLENPMTQRNLDILRDNDFIVIEPDSGVLACKDTGKGKLPKESVLIDYVLREIACEKDLKGLHILVTAGPTREPLDPVRYISNRSTGKMGYALARAAMLRGAEVTLVSGPVALEPLPFVRQIDIVTATDMHDAVMATAPEQDIIIKAAAVADYTPTVCADEKIKKKSEDLALPMTRTKDILANLGAIRRKHQVICGFSMETENLIENSRSKLTRKNADFIIANNLRVPGAGFEGDTNVVTVISERDTLALPLLSKDEVSHRILDVLRDRYFEKKAQSHE